MNQHAEDVQAELERHMSRVLHEIAPSPEPDLLARTMRAVAVTQQRRPLLRPIFRLGRQGWGSRLGVAVGIVAGVAVGLSAASLVGGPESSSQRAPSSSPATSTHANPSHEEQPNQALDPDADWEQINLSDPAPGVDGGAIPSDIVPFKGGYVIVGYVHGFCGSDILVPDPGCADRLAELTAEPSLRAAAVWISEDGRSWELVESPSFDKGEMADAATDGQRLVVSGRWYGPGSEVGPTPGDVTIWTSTDGRDWEVAATGSPLPEVIEWTPNGWVGVRNTQGPNGDGSQIIFTGPEFFASDDGLTWSAVTSPGEFGPGFVQDLATNGTATVAVGYHAVSTGDGILDSSRGLVWRTTDGHSWELAPDQDAFDIGEGRGGLFMQTVAALSDGWLSLGRADDAEDGVGAWTSSDGLTWTRLPETSAPEGTSPEPEYMTVDKLLWTDPGHVATGSVAGPGGSGLAMWVSGDAATWELARGLPPANWGIRALIADGDRILAAAATSPSTDNYLPVVLITTR